jgi:hypothetical protein
LVAGELKSLALLFSFEPGTTNFEINLKQVIQVMAVTFVLPLLWQTNQIGQLNYQQSLVIW